MLALRAVVRYGYAVPFVAIAFALLLAIAFIPLLLLVRFRLGSARRRARGWVAPVTPIYFPTLLLVTKVFVISAKALDSIRSAFGPRRLLERLVPIFAA